VTVALGSGVQLVRRSEWGARAPRNRTALVPSYGTTVHWEGPHMGSFPHSACAGKVRSIQNFHMDTRGWSDVAYTALVCPHGLVYEGRWVRTRTAANGTTDGNNRAYAVCYLGGQGDPFTLAAQKATRVVLDWLDTHGGAGPGRNCHRDWKSTECPGDTICTWVRAGQPTPGGSVPTTPPPAPTPTPTPRKAGKVLWLIKMEDDAAWWLTDLLTKRRVHSREDANIIVFMTTAAGQPVQTKDGQPHVLDASQRPFFDRIPVAG
jgi:hypothetical protein